MSDTTNPQPTPATSASTPVEQVTALTDELRPKLARKARTAVNDQLKDLAKEMAQAALEPLLTPEVREQLQAVADEEAAKQLATELAGAEEPRELVFKTVKAFVDGYVTVLYRRDSGEFNESRVAWCPQWWKHGEAFARMDAAWSAFEHLRLDGTTGMSVFWNQHLDPAMAVLLDPEGPFRYCSPSRGHSEELQPLDSPDAPPSAFVNYEITGFGTFTETATGILTPAASAPARPPALEFP
ncbi:DUF4913 domain-containing protein [Nocardia niigatensis]|uniref:DUF4913 domain-containing protein n=1 Tax=Nocardia niigatensis TaxID=209249 RepID=UPI0002E69946|nr:DUF4913 domain-containing protein [Nocardia niigatensis]